MFFSRLSNLKKNYASYLSPNPKKTEAALTSIKSAYSVVTKRVEEIRESVQQTDSALSPATSAQQLNNGQDNDDNVSQTSTDSRRPSAVEGFYVNDQSSETWSAFTGALWDQLWGTDSSTNQNQMAKNRLPLRGSDISEQYEQLYQKLPKTQPGPVAMEVAMTSCSKCLNCHGILYDEEIMSGWTAEDSNLNTKCNFCDRMVVPFLTVRIRDFRASPRPDHHRIPASDVESRVSEEIKVPYLCPLVLRKELENLLETEGDASLLSNQCADDHPIIYWNLLWYNERIAVKSHLPGLCLKVKSLNPESFKAHDSWTYADQRNVYVQCYWDNVAYHVGEPMLYTQWQNYRAETDKKSIKELIVVTGRQDPQYKNIMEQIIKGVEVNDLQMVM